MLIKTEYEKVRPYTTKDGSLVRELMHPDIHGNNIQSLAEAVVAPGSSTSLHCHHTAEEIYHIMEGVGVVIVGSEQVDVKAGDTLFIPPETRHKINNNGEKTLKLLCCCSPPYRHDDTKLLE